MRKLNIQHASQALLDATNQVHMLANLDIQQLNQTIQTLQLAILPQDTTHLTETQLNHLRMQLETLLHRYDAFASQTNNPIEKHNAEAFGHLIFQLLLALSYRYFFKNSREDEVNDGIDSCPITLENFNISERIILSTGHHFSRIGIEALIKHDQFKQHPLTAKPLNYRDQFILTLYDLSWTTLSIYDLLMAGYEKRLLFKTHKEILETLGKCVNLSQILRLNTPFLKYLCTEFRTLQPILARLAPTKHEFWQFEQLLISLARAHQNHPNLLRLILENSNLFLTDMTRKIIALCEKYPGTLNGQLIEQYFLINLTFTNDQQKQNILLSDIDKILPFTETNNNQLFHLFELRCQHIAHKRVDELSPWPYFKRSQITFLSKALSIINDIENIEKNDTKKSFLMDCKSTIAGLNITPIILSPHRVVATKEKFCACLFGNTNPIHSLYEDLCDFIPTCQLENHSTSALVHHIVAPMDYA